MNEAYKFLTGEEIPTSGIYRVTHLRHRLPHEVTLLRHERFPRCSRCADAVTFSLVRAVAEDPVDPFRIVLHELPAADDAAEARAV